jgi:hypothetical protein
MSEPQTSTAEILVHLVRPGVEAQDFHLAEGSTVTDLLRASGIATANQGILIDGVPIEEAVRLVEGAVVTIGSSTGQMRVDKPWHQRISAFQNEELWREYREILENQRRESRSEDQAGINFPISRGCHGFGTPTP